MSAPSWRSSDTSIRHLRVRLAESDLLAASLRMDRLLNSIDFHPSALSPAATLCVKALSDPLPGTLTLQHTDLPYPPPAWSKALTAALDQLVQQAARPALGAPPASAPAVLFLDRAELLACLARDWLDGSLPMNWWWRSLLGTQQLLGQPLQATVLATWAEAVEFIPTALHHLAQQGYVVRFAKRLTPPEVQGLVEALIRRFGLSVLQSALAQVTSQRGDGAVARSKSPDVPANPASPWQAWTPELVGVDLSLQQACLLGVALGLQRSPVAVRSQVFAQAIAHWLSQQTPVHVQPAPQQAATTQLPLLGAPTLSTLGEQGAVQAASATDPEVQRESEPVVMPPSGTVAQKNVANPVITGFATRSTDPSMADFRESAHIVEQARLRPMPTPPRLITHGRGDESKSPTPTASNRQAKVGQAAQPSLKESSSTAVDETSQAIDEPLPQLTLPEAWHEPWMAETISTRYGGLFYLINLGIYLGLYADFTAPLEPGLALNIYDFLALVGEELLGEALHSDPVWPLLARLAGRAEGEAPGQAFVPPDQCTLQDWLAQIMVTLRERLQAALGLAGEEPAALAQLLLAHGARIVLSAAHLDIFFVLDELPIAIRLSGLDRDPGWVPAAGRWVRFHYD